MCYSVNFIFKNGDQMSLHGASPLQTGRASPSLPSADSPNPFLPKGSKASEASPHFYLPILF